MTTIAVLLLIGLLLFFIAMQKAYGDLPPRELKRRARSGHDDLARLMYRAVGYGTSLRAFLWIIIVVLGATLLVVIANRLPVWLAFTASALIVWIGFVWLPASRVSKFSKAVAARMAPVFGWMLNYLHPLFDRLALFIRKHRPVRVHTGLYEVSDLIDLISRQQVQADNRIDKAGLALALGALQFGYQLVRDHLVPRRIVKQVKQDDDLGAKLMGELHDSGHSRFPVYNGKPDNIVGTLYMKDLVGAKEGGKVSAIMKHDVSYIHEEQTLHEAMQVVFKTHHHLFIVVNSFEEYVGIITLEDILEQIVGRPILDEFDQYDDLRAVAAKSAATEHQAHQKSESTTSEEPEVVK